MRHTWKRGLALLQRLDRRVYRRVTALGPPALDRVTPQFVQATDNMAPWFVVAATMAATGGPRMRRTAVRALAAAGLANLTSMVVLKRLFRRIRPDTSQVPPPRIPLRPYTSRSFPSGHTAAAVGFACGVATDAPRPLSALVSTLAGTVAFSRVHSGVHYPGDVLGGAAVGVLTARLARRVLPPRPELATGAGTASEVARTVDPDGRGVVAVVNARAARSIVPLSVSGPPADQVRRALPEARVVVPEAGEDLAAALDEAARACDVLGVVGGDGTVSAAASAALRHDRPLLVLPAGTHDHFAATLGVDSIDTAVAAYRGGRLARVDVGVAEGDGLGPDGRVFVNTASLGAYPRLVEHRERLRPRLGKWLVWAAASRRVLAELRPVDVRVDGQRTRVWWVFVGNCRYRTHTMFPGMRRHLADGALDVRVLAAGVPFPRARALLDLALASWGLGGHYQRRLTDSVIVVREVDTAPLALDGETVPCPPSLRLTKRLAALRVFVPPPRRVLGEAVARLVGVDPSTITGRPGAGS